MKVIKTLKNTKEHSYNVADGKKRDDTDDTEHTLLILPLKEYIARAGEAKEPQDEALHCHNLAQWRATKQAFRNKDGRTKMLLLDFDGTMARFTPTPEETLAVHGFISAIHTFLQKGYKIAVITGRPITGEKGIVAALERSGADKELIDKLIIFGSHGIEEKSAQIRGKVQVLESVVSYTKQQEELLNHIEELIQKDNELKGLAIVFEKKAVGATIHYRGVAEARREDVQEKLNELLATVLPPTADHTNFSRLDNQKYKYFTYNAATASYEIRLNPATTGIQVNKGTAVKLLVEKWGVKVAIAFGDDTTDIDMQTKLQELLVSGQLEVQAFVGVAHDTTPAKILLDATLVVQGQECAVGLLAELAKQAEDQNEVSSKPTLCEPSAATHTAY